MPFLLELIQGDVSAVVERTPDGETDGAAEELQSLGEAEDEAPAAHSWIEQGRAEDTLPPVHLLEGVAVEVLQLLVDQGQEARLAAGHGHRPDVGDRVHCQLRDLGVATVLLTQ